MSYSDIITGLGVFFILLAFFLLTFRFLQSDSSWYYGLNLLGGGLAFYGSLLIASVPFAILEGTWTLVALAGLLGWRTGRRKARE